MPIDFEADAPAPLTSYENASDYYSKIAPSETAKLGAEFAQGPTMLLANAMQRGQFSDASGADRYLAGLSPAPQEGGEIDSPSGSVKEQPLPPDEINKRYGVKGADGKMQPITDTPMGEGLAALVQKQKQQEMDREALLARYQGQHGFVRNFASGTAGFLLDPLNLGSMFVPGIGEESILARLGASTVATRSAARFGAGLTAGAAQMGALSALRYGLEQEQASDYDWRAALKDVAFGAGLGAMFHAGFGGLREAGVLGPDHLMVGEGAGVSAPGAAAAPDVAPEDIASLRNASLGDREAAIKAGVSQIIEGRPVDVSPIIPASEDHLIYDLEARTETAPVSELMNHPALIAAEDRMRAITPTDQQPGFGTDEWKQSRVFDFDGERVVGYDQALPRLVKQAESYSAGPVRNEGHAYIVIGPPAAGKSTLSERIAEAGRAAIVDADDVKKVLPEYAGGVGANAVHEESAQIAEGAIFEHFARQNANIVLPKVGGNPASVSRIIDNLKALGYDIHLVNLSVHPDEAARRMIRRFTKTGRLIPPEYFASIGDKPKRTYMTLKGDSRLASAADVNGHVPFGSAPRLNEGGGLAAAAALGRTEELSAAGRPGRGREPGTGGRDEAASQGAAGAGQKAYGLSRVFYGSKSINVRHELAELRDLVTSHDDNFAVNPAFPPEVQPRDRGAAPARAQVMRIAANLEPERLGPSPEANFGSPIVGPDNVVESGNGRTMALRRAYAAGGDRVDAYKSFLSDLGYDTRGFDQPVLVARRTTVMTPQERADFAHATASSEAQRLGTTETALSDGRLITPDVSQFLKGGDVASAANRDFVRAFVSKLPQGEAAGLMAADGTLSAAGVGRLRAAITARAYGDESVIARAFESRDSNIKSLASALTDSAAEWIKMREAVDSGLIPAEEDITAQVMQAVQTVMRARDNGEKMSDAFRQIDMFADGLPQQVTRFFFKGEGFTRFYSAADMADNLATYARDLVAGAERGTDMFGAAAPGARDVLGGLIQRNVQKSDADPGPLIADVASQQAQAYRDGFAPGIPQTDFDATVERLYGPKTDVEEAPAPPMAGAGPEGADAEMAASEMRVLSSPYLTDEDRAIIAQASIDVSRADQMEAAYAQAGECLTEAGI